MSETNASSTDNVMQRAASSKLSQSVSHIDNTRRHDRRVSDLRQHLTQMDMVTAFAGVASTHHLSAPVVAAFRATPGFEQAVQNFPDASLYNVYPEHKTSANNVAGLESFSAAQTSSVSVLQDKSTAVATAFGDLLSASANTIAYLQTQIREDKQALEASDVDDAVMSTLLTFAVSQDAFTKTFATLEASLGQVTAFNTDNLRAYPQTLKDEVEGMESLATEIGQTLGLSMSAYGLTESDRDASFEPTMGTFADKGLTKAGLLFHLDQANAVLTAAASVINRKDELTQALSDEIASTPTVVQSDDVTLGSADQARLFTSYTTLVSKLIRESVVMTSTLLSAVDAALDIDPGLDA